MNDKHQKRLRNKPTREQKYRTSLSGDHFLNYAPIELDVLRMIFDDPDAFDPEGLVPRHEDGEWDIEFDISVDLEREARCTVENRLIVHDQLRVWDVKRLMLQTLVWPSMFSYAAQIVRNAADILIVRVELREHVC
jgi:hypothetical protein